MINENYSVYLLETKEEFVISIGINDTELQYFIEKIGFKRTEKTRGKCDIIVNKTEREYQISSNDLTYTTSDYIEAVFYVYESLIVMLNKKTDSMLTWHGCTVRYRNHVFALLAGTRTGKSSLAIYLADHGFEVYSDDIFILDMKYNFQLVWLPVKLRDLSVFPFALDQKVLFEGDNPLSKEYEYLMDPCSKEGKQDTPSSLSFIVLNRDRKSKPEDANLRKCSYEEACKYLLFHAKKASYSKILEMGKHIGSLAVKFPVYELRYNSFNDAFEKIITLTNEIID